MGREGSASFTKPGSATGQPVALKILRVSEHGGALRDHLHSEALSLEVRCSPDTQNIALYSVAELLGRALDLDREISQQSKINRLEAQLARYGFAPSEAMPLFLPLFSLPVELPYAPLDVTPQRTKELLLGAVLSLLFSIAEERPVLLLVENLHWADPTTIELLGQILHEAPSAALCVLLTARPEFSPPFSTAGMLQLNLGRLEAAHVEAMVAKLVGDKPLPPAPPRRSRCSGRATEPSPKDTRCPS